MTEYKVVLTDTAKADLTDIAVFIAKTSGEKSIALEFVKELRQKCLSLSEFPERGAYPRERLLRSDGYRYLMYKDYLIFYKIDTEKQSVNIMAVFNAKKDYFRTLITSQ